MALANADEPLSFEKDIKPLFRERDRQSMSSRFDLGSYDDVVANSGRILERLQAGTMPCDGAWPPEQVDVFKRWVDSGTPA
jgi:hypothetical protein